MQKRTASPARADGTAGQIHSLQARLDREKDRPARRRRSGLIYALTEQINAIRFPIGGQA